MLPLAEEKIIALLVFEETFENIVAESKIDESLVKACLRSLISDGYVSPVVQSKGKLVSRRVYNVDQMRDYRYRATAKGIRYIENTAGK